MAHRARTAKQRRDAVEARRARRAAVTDPDVVMEAAAALCDQVVERLVDLHYLDDLAFAQAWVESRDRARPRGAVALRRELQLKGVPGDTIAEVLAGRAAAAAGRVVTDDELPGDADRDAARHLLERRASSLRREPDPRRRRQKAYALLARNGFAPDVCHEVASSVADDDLE